MEYSTDTYENPPVPVTAATMNSHTLAAEEFEDGHKRKNVSSKRQMTLKEAILATHVAKSDGKIKFQSAKSLFEVAMYAIFLIVLVYVSFANVTVQKYYYTKVLGDLFRNPSTVGDRALGDIYAIDHVFDYMDQQLIAGLYWDNNSSETAMVYYENKLLGHPRIRQIKVTNTSCTVVEAFAREIKECFANYEPEKEDKQPFGDNNKYTYSTAEELENEAVWGSTALYEGGGFVTTLPLDDADLAKNIVSELKKDRWIDRGTRLVMIDFSLYNANVNLFCSIRIMFELPATGGVLPSSKLNTMYLLRYRGTSGNLMIALEGVFVGFLIIIAGLTKSSMDDVVSTQDIYNNIASIVLFLAWIKVFKFISVNKTMSQLSATLSRSAKDIGGFAVMFAVFFFAYAQFGYLIFGTQIADYSTFYDAVFALLRTILGDFDFSALERANRVLGPVFFITYVFFVFFVLLNMFLAIINDSYVEVKAELARDKDESGILDWIRIKFAQLRKGRSGTRPISPGDLAITYEDYKNELLRAGYREDDVMEAFTKLDVNGAELVSEKAMSDINTEMQTIMEKKRQIHNDHREFVIVNRRVDHMESAISSVVSRVDGVLGRLSRIEEGKVKAREHANRLAAEYAMSNQAEVRRRINHRGA